jgi:allene oxide cyclase-like protein
MRRLSLAIALSVVGAIGTSYSASAAALSGDRPAPARQACRVVAQATEQTVDSEYIGSLPPIQKVGDGAVYSDAIYGPSGTVIGHVVGYGVGAYVRPSDGHLIADFEESIQLPGGTVRDIGTIDRNAMLSGAPVYLHAIGESGDYLGESGYRELQVLSLANQTAKMKIVLCG